MLKKLIIVGAFAGMAASVPVIYEQNPDLFTGKPAAEDAAAPEAAAPQRPAPVRKTSAAPDNPLSGRRHVILADGKGHFTGEFKLNGRRTEALVDTGATLVAINSSTARRIGIKLYRKRGRSSRHD